MKDWKLPKEKHLTLEAREEIQRCLEIGVTFKDIARRVGKSASTISREVKKHLTIKEASVKRTKADGTLIDKACPELLKAPFVCNPCGKTRHCSHQKQFYYAKVAQKEYESLLVESREGIPLNKQEFYEADAIIKEGIKKGQRLYHIMQSKDVGFSISTAYRHLHRGYLSVGKLDFPRVVKFKARKRYRVVGVPKAAKVGRTYSDFRTYIDENSIKHWVEMDTVIGRVGGKVIMTFDFTRDNFMFGLLLDGITAAEASERVRALKRVLATGDVRFGDVIPLLLTDNGGEFANIAAFTDDADGIAETRMYFCDPYCSSQKPKVEKNHTMFRDIVPKGESFDHFTQETVNLIFSHVNGIKRKSLNGKSPYETFSFMYGEDVSALLGINYIPPDEVVQSPKLLKMATETFTATSAPVYAGNGMCR
jgi:IS30 family transposase